MNGSPHSEACLVGFGRESSGMWDLSDPSAALQPFGCFITLKDGMYLWFLHLINRASVAVFWEYS